MWIALGVVVALIVAFFVARSLMLGKMDSDYEKNKFVPVRQWAWEMQLSDAEEAAVMQGLEAFQNSGRSLYINHDEGIITLYEPTVIISLFLFGTRFRALGPNALANPAAAVKHVFDGLLAREEPGVLFLQPNWYPEEVDGMDNNQFTEEVRKVLESGSVAGLPGFDGWYSDENFGEIKLRILDQPSEAMHALRAADKYQEAEYAKSYAVNTMVIDLARVLARYRALRAARSDLAPPAALRIVLVDALSHSAPGIMWSKVTASPLQQAIVLASAEGRSTLQV
ncbi:hypothetical protein LZC95_48470 [Pendulispora brunnea]|uniref:Uncharacterized protein n=1 Tax=Pendulispora brunnea TaxID=2905690 RepID=A0ABZ2K9M5_9BACT